MIPGYDQNAIYNINWSDPQKRGAPIKSFASKSTYVNENGTSLNDFITRTAYTYQTQTLANKVYVNVPTQLVNTDNLSGTTTQQTMEYDSYYNSWKTTANFGDGNSKIEEYTFDNNLTGYYLGRPLTKKNTSTNANGSYTTEEEYSYTGFLPTQVKRKGNGTAWVTENFQYDGFGNNLQSTIIAGGVSRTSNRTYDPSGRFQLTHTDVEGMTSSATYDAITGSQLSSTNAFGQTTTFIYDIWGRLTQSEDDLGISSYKLYEADGNGYKVTESSNDGAESITYSNSLGQTVQQVSKNTLGAYVGKGIQYDVYGRAYRESQPSSPGSYWEWNESEFDTFGRLKKTTSYTGKIGNVSYAGLTTTVSEGSKTVSTTKNAVGQTTRVVDLGGMIDYSYEPNGKLKSATYDGNTQLLEYDGWGRKTKLTDPSAGVYEYSYNGFGELLTETTPKGITTNTYEPSTGKLLSKTVTGDASLSYLNAYDNTTKLPTKLTFTNVDGDNTIYDYTYDNHKRKESVKEDNSKAIFLTTYTYDTFGRIASESYQATNKRNGKIAGRAITHSYQNGELLQSNDQLTGLILSKTNAVNTKGQLTGILQGNNLSTAFGYDNFNLPSTTVLQKIGVPSPLLSLNYAFDSQTGNLNSRSQSNGTFSWSETFGYDNLDRLTSFNDNNGSNQQQYDARGRITANSQLGNYAYNSNGYRQSELTNLTPAADTWYQAKSLQQISYNAFKQPINITETGIAQIDFEYNAAQQRSHRYYGSNDADKNLRPLQRHYSEDGVMEITDDIANNVTSFIFYLDGDAYSAPAIYKEVNTASGITDAQLYYLHRDHLGSIVMITNQTGDVVEKRQFDAWGNIVKLEDGLGNPLAVFAILDRGYTGHEHLFEVGLIHMNGRLYDPKLHRFLSPDNFVQDPYNTQNFNRYGYVINNPLSYIDKNGEFFWMPIIIGAILGAYTGGTLANNGQLNPFKWDYSSGRTWGSMLGGAVVGGFSAYAGGAVTSWLGANVPGQFGGLIAAGVGGATAGAVSGAGFAGLSGGNVLEGLWKGGVSGLVGGAAGGYIGGGAGAFAGGAISASTSTLLYGGDIGDVAASALMGGASSYGIYQLQMTVNYSQYLKATKGDFQMTRNQFNVVSTAMQRSFSRGKEYGGWLMDDGSVEMRFQGQDRKGLDLGIKPTGARMPFHTHPNISPKGDPNPWRLEHGPQDLLVNKTVYHARSWVYGRNNVYSNFWTSPKIYTEYSSKLFYPYPFNTYYFPR